WVVRPNMSAALVISRPMAVGSFCHTGARVSNHSILPSLLVGRFCPIDVSLHHDSAPPPPCTRSGDQRNEGVIGPAGPGVELAQGKPPDQGRDRRRRRYRRPWWPARQRSEVRGQR